MLEGHILEVLAGLPAQSVHCVVTSPPYWMLRAYGTPPQTWPDGWVGELGQEPTPEAYIAHLVQCMAAVRRVLRSDGTLWVNLSGSFYTEQPGGQNGSTGNVSAKAIEANRQAGRHRKAAHPIYRGLDWVDIPGLFAHAMQAAGWYWRSDVVWIKPSALPESVQGTRWERCRVKLAMNKHRDPLGRGGEQRMREDPASRRATMSPDWLAEWASCPGCPRCAPTDGYVLRRGNGRPTKATERVLLFIPRPGAYFDSEAVREDNSEGAIARFGNGAQKPRTVKYEGFGGTSPAGMDALEWRGNGRNLRDWWLIGPEPLKSQHYAAYPSALPSRCIQAGTSERGCCPSCGAPWARVVEHQRPDLSEFAHRTGTSKNDPLMRRSDGAYAAGLMSGQEWNERAGTTTLGWRPTCTCGVGLEPIPCTILDPFAGAGTTLLAADRLGRDAIGIELKGQYVALARSRIYGEAPLLRYAEGWTAEEAPSGTKQRSHPNPTVRGFNERWTASTRPRTMELDLELELA